MTEKMPGVCIIGCGMMGNIHADCWSALPNARIVAVVDLLDDRAADLAAKHHLPRGYRDYHEAVALPEVDVVSVCIPTYLHCEVTVFAAGLKKHVLCEKPIALTVADAQRMRLTAEANGVRLGIGLMRRHSPVAGALKDFISAGKLGRPVLYQTSDVRSIRPKLAMHDPAQNGGPMIDMAVHFLDTWNLIFGARPLQISAFGTTLATGQPALESLPQLALDTATFQARFPGGDMAHYLVTWGMPLGVNPTPLPDRIIGPNGMAEVVFDRNLQQLRWLKEGGEWETIAACNEDMYRLQTAAMAAWILEDQPYPSTALQGEEALAVALEGLQIALAHKSA